MAKKRDNETGKYIKSAIKTKRVSITLEEETYKELTKFILCLETKHNKPLSLSMACRHIIKQYLNNKKHKQP